MAQRQNVGLDGEVKCSKSFYTYGSPDHCKCFIDVNDKLLGTTDINHRMLLADCVVPMRSLSLMRKICMNFDWSRASYV